MRKFNIRKSHIIITSQALVEQHTIANLQTISSQPEIHKFHGSF